MYPCTLDHAVAGQVATLGMYVESWFDFLLQLQLDAFFQVIHLSQGPVIVAMF
jgi:hypothetical protein